ncbi:MAG: hypothetical protein M0R28_20285 [Pigmentiphaga sp.]|nr:hypothetical protein [Pigmentiphaga sp.]
MMTEAQKQNVARQEAAKAAVAAAQERSTEAMMNNDRAAWDAAQADMRAAEAEWDAARKESHDAVKMMTAC